MKHHAHQIRGLLLIVLGCALIPTLSRDVHPEARAWGQVGTLFAFAAMVVLHLGATLTRKVVG